MKVSVLMITYNHENFIAQAIESVLMQKTSFNFELVIGEDFSSDKTREICSRFEKKYPSIIKVYYNNQNIGMTNNFVNTYLKCKGNYIAMLEGDDYWTDPLKLQKQVEFLDKNNKYIFSFHDSSLLNDKNEITSTSLLENKGKSLTSCEIVKEPIIPTQTVVFRNNYIKKFPHSFFKIKNTDSFLFSILAHFGNAYFHANIDNSVYRIHESGVWSTQGIQTKFFQSFYSLKKIRNFNSKYLKKCTEKRIDDLYFQALTVFKENSLYKDIAELCRKYMLYYFIQLRIGKLLIVYKNFARNGNFNKI